MLCKFVLQGKLYFDWFLSILVVTKKLCWFLNILASLIWFKFVLSILKFGYFISAWNIEAMT